MLVKCRICGNKVDRSIAYKVAQNDKNLYYCDQKEYFEWLRKKEVRDQTYHLIYDIFGRTITNTILFKEVDALATVYTFEKIKAFLEEKESYLRSVMSKDFCSEYAKIRYFAAILKNSLADFVQEEETVVRKIDLEVSSSNYKRKTKRKGFCEKEIEFLNNSNEV